MVELRLAKYHRSTRGREGYNVFRKKIPAFQSLLAFEEAGR